MSVVTQIEILDLRHFSARQIRPLLEEEGRAWKQRLRWNYESSIELLLQYLDSRVLPGFVALDRGRICGFTFCVYEGNKAVVGDVYAVTDSSELTSQIIDQLLFHLLELLGHSPDIERIESQMLLYDSGAIEKNFRSTGFTLYPRLFMEYDAPSDIQNRTLFDYSGLDSLNLAGWTAACYQPVAELIHSSYASHIDASINDQYQTLHGSLRFLHNIVRFPGCGVFDATSSLVLRNKKDDTLAGVLLCSRVAPEVAHITQICVAPQYRGKGLGRFLMETFINRLNATNFSAITLTVTEANLPAINLYRSLGFKVRHRFEAMVKDKRLTPRDSSAPHV